MTAGFQPGCRKCPRLAAFLDEVRAEYPRYFSRPVPSFGDPDARLLIVGLAPGKHGANATGRPFTGDHAGILLYQTLFEFGFGSQPCSNNADDGLMLRDCRITNAVRCLPPENKPTTSEVDTCNAYLADELLSMPVNGFVLALGTIAHRSVLKALNLKLSAFRFGHGAEHEIGAGLKLIDSYHCSRYNTQTRRLTSAMFTDVFRRLRAALDDGG
ncbi:MAG: uracil-DNA glycosylase [Gammaproteobacteria bacterium]|jgi:uracil-DNA glycosylase family 4|nr:SPO1 DNA polymerase [Chromatiales bacterium]MCP4927347.1 uracil-DNA glycosylase [Gammaproteobacteria bacterium]MDP7296041.1 uracil-DNA glycosylase [Gammaproteobacteria bacterium]MDP7419454.1 uracil-DNA glycosylase [Gammaproteobacteria bacterium]MDP7661458.1 uracil-DNA glycosylase [Gammaproteobacteria bacterium]